MENFSIVKFLQSMLTPTQANPQNTEQTNAPETPAQNQETPPEPPSWDNGQQAVLRFMEEHERRAKKARK